jgi:hypothetical protein
MRALAATALAGVAVLAACKRDTSLYCDTNDTTCPSGYYCEPINRICIELVDGAVIPCDQTHPCSEPLPFCLDGTCAECGGNPDCEDNPLPVCGPDNTCIGCEIDDDCADGVCLFDGTCADADNVIYTEPNGLASGACDIAVPCDLDYGATLVDATRNIIHLAPGEHDTTTSVDPGASATLIGRGAQIRYTGGPDDNVVEFDGSGTLGIYYLEIHSGRGAVPQGSGIRCQNGTLILRDVTVRTNDNSGIYLNPCDADIENVRVFSNDAYGLYVNGGAVTVNDATIRNNTNLGVRVVSGDAVIRRSIIRNNAEGGLDFTGGPHTVENTLIIANGNGGSQVGGVRFAFGSQVFRFNTLAANNNASGDNTGMICADTWTGSSNLFDDEVDPECVMDFSLFTVGAGVPVGGANNVIGVTDPMFVTTDPAMAGFYHLEPGSMAVNAAEALTDVIDDVDRQPRPSPSNTARDIGADEVQ